MSTTTEYVVDFPTLWVAADWIEAHCIVPDGNLKGEPFRKYDWQLWCTVNHYRVRPRAKTKDANGNPIRAAAFHNRISQVVGPQKCGKGPDSATLICLEAVGPALFVGWAKGGESYDCADHGCSCGWGYEYQRGEAMGGPWPTPLIQMSASSYDQVDNVYRPLESMIRHGVLGRLMQIRQGFIRLPNDGRIDRVTSAANSRLGNPVTAVFQDESGLYTKTNKLMQFADTQRRSLAGMSGRAVETTNCWDPSEASVAQQTWESRARDVFRFYRKPPTQLRYDDPDERQQIHAFNYADSPHVDLDSINGLADELMDRDPPQAERFFGNRVVYGLGSWLDDGVWDRALAS